MPKRAFLGESTQAYQYRTDPATVPFGRCEDAGTLHCSGGNAGCSTIKQAGDEALFGRARLTSGSPCGARLVDEPCPIRKRTPMQTGFVPQSKSSLKEVDVTRYAMMPRSFPDGYNGLDYTLNKPTRLLSSLKANQEQCACQPSSYRSYGRIIDV